MKQKMLKSRSNSSRKQQNQRYARSGSAVLIPMVCLVLSLTIIGELLKQSSIEHKQLIKEQYRLQSIWLADAAAQRAAVKLSHQPDYKGETWTLSPEEIGGKYPGEVFIKIDRNQKNNKLITIRTEASYPAKETARVRTIREWPFVIRDNISNN